MVFTLGLLLRLARRLLPPREGAAGEARTSALAPANPLGFEIDGTGAGLAPRAQLGGDSRNGAEISARYGDLKRVSERGFDDVDGLPIAR
jgi:hypothetical protein